MMSSLLPYDYANSNRVLFDPDTQALVAQHDADFPAIIEANRLTGVEQAIDWLSLDDFEKRMLQVYANHRDSSLSIIENIEEDREDLNDILVELGESTELLDTANSAPIIRLFNAVLGEALKAKASDIHIEPYEAVTRIRFRLDGMLHEMLSPNRQVGTSLVSRIKVLANLDIAERRLPQDGRMVVSLGGVNVDLRISTIPSSYGERVVMRILDKQSGRIKLQDIGMPQDMQEKLREITSRPHGIMLVTGPTGSGKSTTLYAALQELDSSNQNIMTVEDPVEYEIPGISQTQINTRAGMSFSRGLRAILRQDPDVILIGEIRDQETAEIATQASLTGHLVLSTLHTNTAIGAISRLNDLGVESFLLSSTICGVMSQRLVRTLCNACKQQQPATHQQKTLLKVGNEPDCQLFSPIGCSECQGTGYSGRIGLFELIVVDDELGAKIYQGASEEELSKAVRKSSTSLFDSGIAKVREGITTLEEVLRVTSA